jgi:hypothetical protein
MKRLGLIALAVLALPLAPAAGFAPRAAPPRDFADCFNPAQKKLRHWIVCLEVSRHLTTVGKRVTLTAEVNQDMRPGNRKLVIIDVTDRETVEVCHDDGVCSVKVRQTEIGAHKYAAAVVGLRGGVPRSRTLAVAWLNFELTLSIYAHGRGPGTAHPALLCEADAECGTNALNVGMPADLFIKASKEPPKGLSLVIEDTLHTNAEERVLDTDNSPRRCAHGFGCRFVYGDDRGLANDPFSVDDPQQHRFLVSLYPTESGVRPKPSDRVFSSNQIEIKWSDWAPQVTVAPGPRVCQSSGACVYKDSTLSATVQQPLEPGVVLLLYLARGCVPQPGDPAGDPGCNAFSPRNCSPPVRECTFRGDLPAGYDPGAVVVFNSPRPMLLFASRFLPTLQ